MYPSTTTPMIREIPMQTDLLHPHQLTAHPQDVQKPALLATAV